MSAGLKLAFIGLGTMGFPMAGHLANAGHSVRVFNRTAAKARLWLDSYRGEVSATPAAAAEGADFVFCCVGNDDDLRAVTTGPDGAFSSMRPDSVFVDHTTTSAEVARELTAVAESAGFQFLDAPVSGGQAGAENGQLTIMAGGSEQAFVAAAAVMRCYAKAVTHMGAAGNGQLTKMVNQIAVAGLIQSLAEALNFAKRAGLDAEKVVAEVISKGAAQSWQMENRYQTMLNHEFDFGFAVEWMRKDLGLCFDEAGQNGAELPIAEIVDRYYAEVQALGGSRWDTSALMARLNNNS